MGSDEAALLCLWREKRGELELEDLSGNVIVQLGLATEALNRHRAQVMAAHADQWYGHPDQWTRRA